MSNKSVLYLLALSLILAGCTVRHYTAIKDRVDQDLTSGNRGYIQGTVPPLADNNRPKTRKTHTLEVEMANPLKFKQLPEVDETKKKQTTGKSDMVSSDGDQAALSAEASLGGITEDSSAAFEEYAVQERDTLQKISSKFYGTTKKWQKIYEANRDTLKSPDRVYPGQKLKIPQE